MEKKRKCAYLGAGSFPAGLVHEITYFDEAYMWEYKPNRARRMQRTRKSIHMPEVTLPDYVTISSSMKRVLRNALVIFIAVPSSAVEAVVEQAKKFIRPNQQIVICSKGFASGQRLLSDAVAELLPHNQVYCFSGPNLAPEMVCKEITGAILAGENTKELKKMLESEFLFVETSLDTIGVQIGGALKNVVTMLIGIAEGAGFLQNTRAILSTKGFKEIIRIGCGLGAFEATFSDMSCYGDLTLNSRNREIGRRIGTKEPLKQILDSVDTYPEGLTTLKTALSFAEHHCLKVPVIQCLNDIVYDNQDPKTSILKLIKSLRKK